MPDDTEERVTITLNDIEGIPSSLSKEAPSGERYTFQKGSPLDVPEDDANYLLNLTNAGNQALFVKHEADVEGDTPTIENLMARMNKVEGQISRLVDVVEDVDDVPEPLECPLCDYVTKDGSTVPKRGMRLHVMRVHEDEFNEVDNDIELFLQAYG